jgi:hypothetical protein
MEERVKLPSSGYTELTKIIAGYSKLDREASLEDVSKLVGVGPTVVSGNNGFLLGVGIIEGGNKKKITVTGKRLGLAIEHDREDDVNAHWRIIVYNNTFLQNLISAVRIRRGMELSSLRAHVAYSAGLTKTKPVMTGAGTVVEILKRSGFLQEQDGKLVATEEQHDVGGLQPVEETPTAPDAKASSTAVRQANVFEIQAPPFSGVQGPAATITIQVQISCTPNDLDGLGAKLRKVIEEVSGREPTQPKDAEES